jgi:hypothetical protein
MRRITLNSNIVWCTALIFFGIVISCSSAKPQRTVSQAKENTVATPLVETNGVAQFKKAVGLVDGEYEATNDPQEVCPVGPLVVRSVGDEFAILIGAELIISKAKLGRSEASYEESGCQIMISVNQNAGKITSKKIQTCKKQVYKFSTTLEVKNEDIFYSVENSQNGKRNLKVACRLERQK